VGAKTEEKMKKIQEFKGQRLISVQEVLNWTKAFILDRKARGFSKGTIYFYRMKLQLFLRFCELQKVTYIKEVTPVFIRKYLLHLENTDHNPGGVHACYRALKTFLRWYQIENDLTDWVNPIDKVRVKNPRNQPLEPVDIETVKAILETCKNDFTGKRDRAIILMLLDTGMRISELLSLEHENINPITGVVQILHGKGNKFRTVYISRKTRLALRKYIKVTGGAGRLFLTRYEEPATYSTVRNMLKRRASLAQVEQPTPHQFRRLFALTMLRNGVDIYSLQLLMGHADLQVLKRYLRLTRSDTLEAHVRGGPVDRLM
jgi:integrase/recombinase XerD